MGMVMLGTGGNMKNWIERGEEWGECHGVS